jgi:hypothetical protein
VATDSIAPATRQTARMLASSGIIAALPGQRARQPPQPAAAALGSLFAVVGEDIAVELACVIRDLDVERRLVPASSAARIHRHLRRESVPCIQYEPQVWTPRAGRGTRAAQCAE